MYWLNLFQTTKVEEEEEVEEDEEEGEVLKIVSQYTWFLYKYL